MLEGKPFLFGQENAVARGGALIPLNVRFFISEVTLLRGSADPVPVDIVTAQGSPAPYGVHFFNAEEPATAQLRVLAPPGDYTGLSFVLGMKLACDQKSPDTAHDPLTVTSQMTWPHTGYLFLRYEARYTQPAGQGGGGAGSGAAGTAGQSGAASQSGGSAGQGGRAADVGALDTMPLAVHMGGDVTREVAPRVTVATALSIPTGGAFERPLTVVMDELFRGASSDVDLSDVSPLVPPSPEAMAGERLRRKLPDLRAFVLEP